MSIDDMVQRDPRITKLAQLVGWSRRETVGCLIVDVWPICYDQREHTISADLVDLAAQFTGFAAAMVSAELATWARGNRKIRVRGAQERIEYLNHKRSAGSVGGINSAKSRAKNSSTDTYGAQARGNPSVPDSASASAPVPDDPPEERDSAPDGAPVLSLVTDKPKKPKRSEVTYTDAELADVDLVLSKLSDRNGAQYQRSKEHTTLIVGRLRAGFTAWDLRRVIAYCADSLGWQDKPDMKPFLRPETLFGPKAMERYVYQARAWMPEERPPEELQPQRNDDAAMTGPRWEEPAWMTAK